MDDERGPSGDEDDQGGKILQHPGISRDEYLLDKSRSRLTKCFRGPIETYRRAVTQCSEASDTYHLACFLTAAGLVIGRRAFIHHGGTKHYANWFMCLVGNTAFGRKTTAPLRVQQTVEDYLACLHSRQSFSPAHLGEALCTELDSRIREVLAPHADSGSVGFDVHTRIEWGRPR